MSLEEFMNRQKMHRHRINEALAALDEDDRKFMRAALSDDVSTWGHALIAQGFKECGQAVTSEQVRRFREGLADGRFTV